MQTGAVLVGLRLSCQICPSRNSSLPNPSRPFNPSLPLPLKFHKLFSLASQNVLEVTSPLRPCATLSNSYNETTELADIDWDNFGFNIQPTDYMYIMKCQQGGTFSKGEIKRYGNIEFSPSAGVLSYGQEGLAPINLIVEKDLHRATPGGAGGVKTIGNYAAVLKAQSAAKSKGYSDALYLDCVHKKYLEEVSSCNIFVVKVLYSNSC
ncbi:hypothetical protein TanjilG_27841 [Lupinus angustifolius]|uniref:Uncharacterized protein n=1 Tax=Lupinus angustifolius TaxID=3871 RepID=A0A4P1RHL4_LUPAN|nr:hypothetical protein TanjilG_27841 [Lupinus angustifolius]